MLERLKMPQHLDQVALIAELFFCFQHLPHYRFKFDLLETNYPCSEKEMRIFLHRKRGEIRKYFEKKSVRIFSAAF